MTHPAADRPEDPRPPATRWGAIRWDLLVLLFAAGGFAVNYLRPDELSSTMRVAFLAAIAWVAYRIVSKLRAFRERD